MNRLRWQCIPSIDIHLPSLSPKRTQRKADFLFIRAFDRSPEPLQHLVTWQLITVFPEAEQWSWLVLLLFDVLENSVGYKFRGFIFKSASEEANLIKSTRFSQIYFSTIFAEYTEISYYIVVGS